MLQKKREKKHPTKAINSTASCEKTNRCPRI